MEHHIFTQTSTILQRPLAEITPSMSSQITIDQVVAKGRALNARFEGSQPWTSYHGGWGPRKCYNVQSLGTNLMEIFSNNIYYVSDQNDNLMSLFYNRLDKYLNRLQSQIFLPN